jgi:hypothetical protein
MADTQSLTMQEKRGPPGGTIRTGVRVCGLAEATDADRDPRGHDCSLANDGAEELDEGESGV